MGNDMCKSSKSTDVAESTSPPEEKPSVGIDSQSPPNKDVKVDDKKADDNKEGDDNKKDDKEEEAAEPKKEDEPTPDPHTSIDGTLLRKLLVEDDDDLAAMVENLDNKEVLLGWWKDLDHNGNGIVSLAEIHKFVQDKNWKVSHPALLEAYKYTTQTKQTNDDKFVQKKEFPILCRALIYMNRLWDVFDEIDSSDDRRVSLEEFKAAFVKFKHPLTEAAAQNAFNDIDKNGGGFVLFGEFCKYIAKLASPTAVEFDEEEADKEE